MTNTWIEESMRITRGLAKAWAVLASPLNKIYLLCGSAGGPK